jgi:hypothetical protein
VASEIKKVVLKVKKAQGQLHTLMQSQNWVDEARKYAERQGKEVKKLFAPDVQKMKKFLERERKELEKLQKQIPGEVKKLRHFVNLQKKEFEKLLVNVGKMASTGGGSVKSTPAKKTRSKKASMPKAAGSKTSVKKKSTGVTEPSSGSTH